MPSRLSKDASLIRSTSSLEVLSKKTELLKHYLLTNKYILEIQTTFLVHSKLLVPRECRILCDVCLSSKCQKLLS